eukprot:3404734-Rhodomonas_salina.3
MYDVPGRVKNSCWFLTRRVDSLWQHVMMLEIMRLLRLSDSERQPSAWLDKGALCRRSVLLAIGSLRVRLSLSLCQAAIGCNSN